MKNKKMKYIIALTFLFFCSISYIFSQNDSIIYKVSLDIQEKIKKEIENNPEQYKINNESITYIIWENESKDTIVCSLYCISKEKKMNEGREKFYNLVKQTNRYLQVKEYFLPIIFDSDMAFYLRRGINATYVYEINFDRRGNFIKESKVF